MKQCDQKILIVDDEAEVLMHMQRLLEREGYSVSTATNMADAIREFKANKPQLCIVDVYLRMFSLEESGLDFLREIRKFDKTFKTIVISGRCNPQTVMEIQQMSIDAFMVKPLDIDQFRDTIKTMFPCK